MLHHTRLGEAGPKIMIVHGLFGSGRNWGVIGRRLATDFQVILPDLRNHGQSLRHDDHSYAAMAADLAALIEAEGAACHVVGHSMGGKAAMVLALHRPELVSRLIVADIAPVSYGHSQMQYVDAMRRVDLDQVETRGDAARQLEALGVEPALQSFFTQSLDIREHRWLLNLDALGQNMAQILSFPDVSGSYGAPTLFLSGADSDYVDRAHRPAIRALFPQARFAKIPGAGHWLHADKPREFEASVRAFFG